MRDILVITFLALMLASAAPIVIPQVTYFFSTERHVVDALREHPVYVAPGVDGVSDQDVLAVMGTRPIALIVLGDPAGADAARAGEWCAAAVRAMPALLVRVVAGGTTVAGCAGSQVVYDVSDWTDDPNYWVKDPSSAALTAGDIVETARTFAFDYDLNIAMTGLHPTTRTFSAPPHRTPLAIGLAVAAVLGTVAAFFVLRWLAGRSLDVADRRRAWQRQLASIDEELAEIALVMLSAETMTASGRRIAQVSGSVAAEYREALDTVASARYPEDLAPLAERVHAIADALHLIDASD